MAEGLEEPTFIDLEPIPPSHRDPGKALATPFAIQISEDDSTWSLRRPDRTKLFTIDAGSGELLGRVGVGAVPRGIALSSSEAGSPSQAWVLNAVANSVTLVDLSDPAKPEHEQTIALEDPTHPDFQARPHRLQLRRRLDDEDVLLRQLPPGRTHRPIAVGAEDPDRLWWRPDHAPIDHATARTARHGPIPLGWDPRRSLWGK